MQSILIVCLVYPVYSQVEVAYNFYENYGNTYYDVSGNYRHAVNGNSPEEDSQDTLPTDRGAYYDPDSMSSLIYIPKLDAEGGKISFKDTLSIHMWVKLQKSSSSSSGFVIFERVEQEKGLVIFYDFDDGFQIKSSDSADNTEESESDSDSNSGHKPNGNSNNNNHKNDGIRALGEDDIYENWFLLSIHIKKKNVEILNNGNTLKKDDFSYSDSENSVTYIGGKSGKSISLAGFIWNILIDGSVSNSYYQRNGDCNPSKYFFKIECLPTNLNLGKSKNGKKCSNCDNCNDYACLKCECENSSCKYDSEKNLHLCVCPSSITSSTKYCVCDKGNYFNGKSCQTCSISHCKICINEKVCDGCNEGYELKDNKCECIDDNNCIECPKNCDYCTESEKCTNCKEGFYINENKCIECGDLCLECNAETCEKCIDSAENNKNNVFNCSCKEGYTFKTKCIRNQFTASISIDKDNVVTILFSEILNITLESTDFNVNVEGISGYEIAFESKSSNEYLFKVVSSSGIPENCKISITLKKNFLTSQNNSLYTPSVMTETLTPKTSQTSESESISKQSRNSPTTISNIKASTKSLTTAALASSAATSMFTHPSLFWILFNTLELISYMPIGSVPYPASLISFFTYLNSLSIFPSPSSLFGLAGKEYPAYYEARKYGVNSCLFLVNIDIILTHLILNVIFIALLFILRIFVARQFIDRLLGKYKYGYFLKLMIVGTLDFSLFGLIQIRIVFGI